MTIPEGARVKQKKNSTAVLHYISTATTVH